MAQVPLVDKSLSPKEAGHALALDRLLRFIVFGDECGHGQGVAGAQPGSPLGDAYETVKAEAEAGASSDRLIDGVAQFFGSKGTSFESPAGISSGLFAELIRVWKVRARDNHVINSLSNAPSPDIGPSPSNAEVDVPRFAAASELVPGIGTGAVPAGGPDYILVELERRHAGVQDDFDAGIDAGSIGQVDKAGTWWLCLGPGAPIGGACSTCGNARSKCTTDKKASSSQAIPSAPSSTPLSADPTSSTTARSSRKRSSTADTSSSRKRKRKAEKEVKAAVHLSNIALEQFKAEMKEKEARAFQERVAAAEVLEATRKDKGIWRRETKLQAKKAEKLAARVRALEAEIALGKAGLEGKAQADAQARAEAKKVAEDRLEDLRTAHTKDLEYVRDELDVLRSHLEKEANRSAALDLQLSAAEVEHNRLMRAAESDTRTATDEADLLQTQLESVNAQALETTGTHQQTVNDLRTQLEQEKSYVAEISASVDQLEADAKRESEVARTAELARAKADERVGHLQAELDSAKQERDVLRGQEKKAIGRIFDMAAQIKQLDGVARAAQAAQAAAEAGRADGARRLKQAEEEAGALRAVRDRNIALVRREKALEEDLRRQAEETVRDRRAAIDRDQLRSQLDSQSRRTAEQRGRAYDLERKLARQVDVAKSAQAEASRTIGDLKHNLKAAQSAQSTAEERLVHCKEVHSRELDAMRKERVTLQIQLDEETARAVAALDRVEKLEGKMANWADEAKAAREMEKDRDALQRKLAKEAAWSKEYQRRVHQLEEKGRREAEDAGKLAALGLDRESLRAKLEEEVSRSRQLAERIRTQAAALAVSQTPNNTNELHNLHQHYNEHYGRQISILHDNAESRYNNETKRLNEIISSLNSQLNRVRYNDELQIQTERAKSGAIGRDDQGRCWQWQLHEVPAKSGPGVAIVQGAAGGRVMQSIGLVNGGTMSSTVSSDPEPVRAEDCLQSLHAANALMKLNSSQSPDRLDPHSAAQARALEQAGLAGR